MNLEGFIYNVVVRIYKSGLAIYRNQEKTLKMKL